MLCKICQLNGGLIDIIFPSHVQKLTCGGILGQTTKFCNTLVMLAARHSRRRIYVLPQFFFFYLLLLLFVSYPPSSRNRTQPKPATCSEVSAIWKWMSEIWGILSPIQIGPKAAYFRRLRNLKGYFTHWHCETKLVLHIDRAIFCSVWKICELCVSFN